MESLKKISRTLIQRRWARIFVIAISIAVSMLLFGSKGTVDARNWETIFEDILVRGSAFIPDCLNYVCPSNMILTKFPPGHALTFYLFSLVFPVRLAGILISMKSLILLFYIATLGATLCFSRVIRGVKSDMLSVVTLYASLISLILSTQGLAYTDILVFPFLVVSIMCLIQRRFFWSGLLFGMGCLMKWQPIILLPLVLIYLVTNTQVKDGISRFLQFIGGLVVSVLLLYPITDQVGGGLLLSLRNVLAHTTTYALNVQWVIQNVVHQIAISEYESPTKIWVWIQLMLFTFSYALICWNIFRHKGGKEREENLLHNFLLGALVYYLFSFGVHENHFILGTIVALLLYIYRPTAKNYMLLRIVDAINVLNLFVFYGLTGVSFFGEHRQGIDTTVFMAGVISIASILYLWYSLIKKRNY